MMRIICILSMLFAGAVLGAASIRVGNVGIRGIVLPDNAPDSVRLAASELQKFAAKVTGVKLPLVNRADGEGFIILGANKELLKNAALKSNSGNNRLNLFITNHSVCQLKNNKRPIQIFQHRSPVILTGPDNRSTFKKVQNV